VPWWLCHQSSPPYMVHVTILPSPLPLLLLLAFCQTVTPCYIQRISGVVFPDVQPRRSLLPASLRPDLLSWGRGSGPMVAKFAKLQQQ
jgi:hypothetical protein